VDTSVDGIVTLVPCEGKGLERIIDDEDYEAEAGDMEWENFDADELQRSYMVYI
jgi:hypothetical protein